MPTQRTVLHVDDDPDVLELSSDWAGVRDETTWLTASDPEAGMELLSTHDIDCLVSDSFRTADGDPFVMEAVDAFPDLSIVLFTSTAYDDLDSDLREADVEYVQKGSADPFETLFDRLHTPTDAPSSSIDVAPRAEVRSDGDDTAERWEPIARYRSDDSADLATVIVSAVEEYSDRPATDFPPLYESIDADALASLCHRSNGEPRDGVQVRFYYADHELAVTSDGLVLVRAD